MSDGITDAMRESDRAISRENQKAIYFKDLDRLRQYEPGWFDDYLMDYIRTRPWLWPVP